MQVKFTQELKDKWIENYKNVPHCSGSFKKGECLCAYGALYDVLVKEGHAKWEGRVSFSGLARVTPYFLDVFKCGTEEAALANKIWETNDMISYRPESEHRIVSKVVELIKQLPVEE